jgi:hypothetical protein
LSAVDTGRQKAKAESGNLVADCAVQARGLANPINPADVL